MNIHSETIKVTGENTYNICLEQCKEQYKNNKEKCATCMDDCYYDLYMFSTSIAEKVSRIDESKKTKNDINIEINFKKNNPGSPIWSKY